MYAAEDAAAARGSQSHAKCLFDLSCGEGDRSHGQPGALAPHQGAQAMKFLFMIFHDEGTLDAMPKDEMQTLVDAAIDYTDEIEKSGHYIVSNALQRARTARTIKVRGAETKEQLGGFFLIEAKDMDEACAVAARFPPARIATIEVRPVQELHHS